VKYQLVLPWPCSPEADCPRLLLLEDAIRNGLGSLGIVDGHDIGSGEMNVFIHTNNPIESLERSKLLITPQSGLHELKAGYRDFDAHEYIGIHPAGLTRISVI
jgi:hypothetical protein